MVSAMIQNWKFIMSTNPSPKRKKTRDVLALVGFVGICLLVSAIGGAVTANSVDTWYQAINKPRFNPPEWVFAPVWTALYILMAIAGWRIWRSHRYQARSIALFVYCIQLVLNLAWSFLFFGLQRIDLALIQIAILLLAIIFTAYLFWKIDRYAGAILIPYAVWVAFASTLNLEIWRLN